MASERIAKEEVREQYKVKRGVVVVCLEIGISLAFVTGKIIVMSVCINAKEGSSMISSIPPLVFGIICSFVLWITYQKSYDKPFLRELSYRRLLRTIEPPS